MSLNESIVEDAALEWFGELGYAIGHGPELAPGEAAEEQGFGLTSLKKQAEKLGLPLPSYSMEGDSLVLTIYRSKAGAVAGLRPEVRENLNDDERKGWEFLTTKPSVTRREYAEQLGFDDRKAQRHLKHFVELGLLRKVGASSSTEYEERKP